MTNRALEFLYHAQDSFPLLHDRWGWKAKHFVELAIAEVIELQERLALYEMADHELMRIEARVHPALLVENDRTRMMLEMKNRQLVDGKRQAVDMEVSQ